MFKVTPNPPDTGPVPYNASLDLDTKKMKAAADRALSFYLNPGAQKEPIPSRSPNSTFLINPTAPDETLLVQACDTLASAIVMVSEFADLMEGPHRKRMLLLQQVITMGEMAVNRVLDNHKPG